MIFTTAVAGEALLVVDVRFFFKFCTENKTKNFLWFSALESDKYYKWSSWNKTTIYKII